MKYTPGPWELKLGLIRDRSDARHGGLYVRDLFVVLPEALPTEIAIAVAAPDLLAACGAALRALELFEDEVNWKWQKDMVDDALRDLRDAIRKATGDER